MTSPAIIFSSYRLCPSIRQPCRLRLETYPAAVQGVPSSLGHVPFCFKYGNGPHLLRSLAGLHPKSLSIWEAPLSPLPLACSLETSSWKEVSPAHLYGRHRANPSSAAFFIVVVTELPAWPGWWESVRLVLCQPLSVLWAA